MLDFLTRHAKTLLDIILPRTERVIRLNTYTETDLPVQPAIHDALGYHITTLMPYDSPITHDIIRALKYDSSARATELLAASLAEYLQEEISQLKTLSVHPVILVPVPLHPHRQHERGFNQVESVLNALPPEFQNGTLSHVAHILARIRQTPSQTTLSRHERLKNVEDAFALTVPNLVAKAHVFLIDDVTTTGATLTEAARPLQPVAASVRLLALARA